VRFSHDDIGELITLGYKWLEENNWHNGWLDKGLGKITVTPDYSYIITTNPEPVAYTTINAIMESTGDFSLYSEDSICFEFFYKDNSIHTIGKVWSLRKVIGWLKDFYYKQGFDEGQAELRDGIRKLLKL
jgi:hypothetical protein